MSADVWDRCGACGSTEHGLVAGAHAAAAIREASARSQREAADWRREAYSTRIDAAHAIDAWLDGDRYDVRLLERLRDDLMNLPDAPRPADETEAQR